MMECAISLVHRISRTAGKRGGSCSLVCLLFCLFSGGNSARFLLQVSMNKRIDIACQVALGIAGLIIRPMILHDVVGMDGHGANLRPEVGLDVFSLEPGGLFRALFLLQFIEASLEQFERNLAVLDL